MYRTKDSNWTFIQVVQLQDLKSDTLIVSNCPMIFPTTLSTSSKPAYLISALKLTFETGIENIFKTIHAATAGFQKSKEVWPILINLDYNSDKPQSPLLFICVTKEYPTLHFKKDPFSYLLILC